VKASRIGQKVGRIEPGRRFRPERMAIAALVPDSLKGCKGFTLLELIIVTVLAVLVLGLTTLFFGNALPSARFDATGRDMIATMRQMKALARNSGEDQVLTIDLDGRRYGIEGGKMKVFPAGIAVKVDDSLSGNVWSGTYPIVFHAMGGVEGGAVILSYKKKTLRVQTDPILGARAERS
jgi:prepilin-type N-terminal cleavage/methylation domain-containing protein